MNHNYLVLLKEFSLNNIPKLYIKKKSRRWDLASNWEDNQKSQIVNRIVAFYKIHNVYS